MDYLTTQGERVPKIGFGTWRLSGSECYRAVRSALQLGYRHFDTAEMYANEAEVARAIADSGVNRRELFLTTKVWHTHLRHHQVLQACDGSLRALRVEAIDLYLVHWPDSSTPIEETMGALNDLVHAGKVRRIGVSNFSVDELAAAQAASSVPLLTDQVPMNILNQQRELRGYCIEHDMMLTAYRPLDKGQLGEHPQLRAIGARHGKSAAQVALRWLIQLPPVVAIPKSADPGRQRQNLEIFDFELSAEEMADLDAMAEGSSGGTQR